MAVCVLTFQNAKQLSRSLDEEVSVGCKRLSLLLFLHKSFNSYLVQYLYIEHLRVYFDPSGKNTYLYSCWVCFGFFVCCLIYFPFFVFGYGMSIESLVVVERQPDNQPKATNTDCLSCVFPVLLF